jgi:hypothetical protein
MSPTQTRKQGPENRSHARQATENLSLGTGEKTLPNLLIDTLLEGEDFSCELCNDARGYDVLCGQGDALGSGCAMCLVRYVCGPFDATVSEVS